MRSPQSVQYTGHLSTACVDARLRSSLGVQCRVCRARARARSFGPRASRGMRLFVVAAPRPLARGVNSGHLALSPLRRLPLVVVVAVVTARPACFRGLCLVKRLYQIIGACC